MSKPVARLGWGLLVLVLLAGVLGLAWMAWQRSVPPAPESPAPYDRGQPLRVGYAPEAPYAWVDSQGNVTGESPMLAREVARRLGLRVQWVQLGFDQLVPALERGQIDVIAAGLFITPQRAQRVRFAHPSLVVRPGLLLSKSPAAGIPAGVPTTAGDWTWAQLVAAMVSGQPRALKVAVIDQSVEWSLLQAQPGAAAALVVVPDAVTGQAALQTGLADALALSLPTVRWMASQHPDRLAAVLLRSSGAPEQGPAENFVAAAFRPQDETLQRDWNRVQAEVLALPTHRERLRAMGLHEEIAPVPPPHAASSP